MQGSIVGLSSSQGEKSSLLRACLCPTTILRRSRNAGSSRRHNPTQGGGLVSAVTWDASNDSREWQALSQAHEPSPLRRGGALRFQATPGIRPTGSLPETNDRERPTNLPNAARLLEGSRLVGLVTAAGHTQMTFDRPVCEVLVSAPAGSVQSASARPGLPRAQRLRYNPGISGSGIGFCPKARRWPRGSRIASLLQGRWVPGATRGLGPPMAVRP